MLVKESRGLIGLCLLFLVLLLASGFTQVVFAYRQSEIDWVSCGNFSTELLWGNKVNVSCENEQYILVVKDFSVEGDFVVLDIFYNDTLLTSGFMQVNESFYYNKSTLNNIPVRVVVGGISGEYQVEQPTYSIVDLQVLTLGRPNLSVSTNTTDSSTCVYNTSVVVNNSGTARLKDVVVSYELADELYVVRTNADRPYNTPRYGGRFVKRVPLFGELKVGESVGTWFEVIPPALSTTQYYPIKVSIGGRDILGREYRRNFTYNISVPRSLIATKSITVRRPYAASSYIGTVSITSVSESETESEQVIGERAYPSGISRNFTANAVPYVGDQLLVSLSVYNTGCSDIEHVELGEIIPSDLILDPYKDVNLSSPLRSKSSVSINYTLRPLSPVKYSMPSTIINTAYKGRVYSTLLDLSGVTLTFHGPDIVVRKNVTPATVVLGEVVTVNLTVENRGDRSARVVTYDSLPTGSSIKSGTMKLEGVIHPAGGGDEPRLLTTSYAFKVNRPGKIRLPAARVEFVDITHYNNTVYSNRPVLIVVKELPVTADVATTPVAVVTSESLPVNGTGNVSDNSSILPMPGFGLLGGLFVFLAWFVVYRVK